MRVPINQLVNQALEGWVDLVGIDEEGRIQKDNPWNTYALQDYTKELNASREFDPTGLTTFMMLRGLIERYLKDVSFSAYSIVLDPKGIEAQIAPMRKIRDILDAPEVVEIIEDFQDQLRRMAKEYGVRLGEPMTALEDLISNRYDLAFIRKDAIFSNERLEIHQFTQGESDPKPLKFNPQVYEFWNINSLLAAMRGQKVGGISLCLIRDPEEALHSYFVFAIRNGGTLTILTDRDKTPHPAYNRMSRRPDRAMSARAARNWFPYHLLDLRDQKDELGNVKRIYTSARKQLVPINVDAVPLKDIRDLQAEEFVWTALMFDLIREKFWKENKRVPELSYTGQMVVEPQALVSREGALVKEGLYKPLELPALKNEDVTAESTAAQWQDTPTGFNRWMVERYGHLVPNEVLNPVGSEAKLLLETEIRKGALIGPVDKTDSWGRIEKTGLETLNPLTFGTKEEIDKDRIWVARCNQMKVIQKFAEDEYDKEHEALLEWYKNAIERNQEAIFDACARGEFVLPTWKRWDPENPFNSGPQIGAENRLSQKILKRYERYSRDLVILGNIRDWRVSYCAERPDTRATIFSFIDPTCPQAIAALCGVEVPDLPWAFQHWHSDAPYAGNHILNRLDPEDWVLRNPWLPPHYSYRGFTMTVGVCHSKRALHARRKALGLPRKDYKEPEENE